MKLILPDFTIFNQNSENTWHGFFEDFLQFFFFKTLTKDVSFPNSCSTVAQFANDVCNFSTEKDDGYSSAESEK